MITGAQSAGFWRTVWEDMRQYSALKPQRRFPSAAAVVDALLQPAFMAVFVFRVGNRLFGWHLKPFARLAYIFNLVVFGHDQWPGSKIGPGLVIPHPVGVAVAAVLGARVTLFGHVQIGAAGYEDPSRDGVPVLMDGVTVFAGGKIFGPVTVGEGALITANTLVMKTVPAGAVVMGSPGRIVRFRDGYPGAVAKPPRPQKAVGE